MAVQTLTILGAIGSFVTLALLIWDWLSQAKTYSDAHIAGSASCESIELSLNRFLIIDRSKNIHNPDGYPSIPFQFPYTSVEVFAGYESHILT